MYENIPTHLIDIGENIGRRVARDITPLQTSIAESGLLHPLTVSAAEDGRYRLIAGFGRFEAIRRLEWDRVPCRVVYGSRQALDILAVGENLDRQTYGPWDEANAYYKLYLLHGMSVEAIATRFHRHPNHVHALLGLIKRLSPKVQAALDSGTPIPVTYLMRWKTLPPDGQDHRLARWLLGDPKVGKETARKRLEASTIIRFQDLLRLAPTSPEREAVLQSLDYLLGNSDLPTFIRDYAHAHNT